MAQISWPPAHKILQLPIYVQVTNIKPKNGHKILVKVSGCGPLHEGRIIELSRPFLGLT